MATNTVPIYPYCYACLNPANGQITFSDTPIDGYICNYDSTITGCSVPPPEPPPPEPPPPEPAPEPTPEPSPPEPEWSETGGYPYCYRCNINYLGTLMYRIDPTQFYECVYDETLPGCELPGEGPPDVDPDLPDLEYVVQLPGLQDIVRVPVLENRKLRKERYLRFMAAQTVIPKPLRWIPGAINWLDDCQDLLITALYLARPLLVKLPLRFVPYLGWVLLANDVLNLATGLLATASGGRSFKRATLDAIQAKAFLRPRTLLETSNFLTGKIPWLSVVLQGAQAAQQLTGYGLSLGALMGFVTGGFWASIRLLQGNQVTIAGIPKEDILGKSVRVLTQSWQIPGVRNIFSQQERDIVLSAGAIASQIVRERAPGATAADGWAIVANDQTPLPDDRFQAEFVQTLNENNIPFDPYEVGGGVIWSDPTGRPTINQVISKANQDWSIWEQDQRERDGMTTHGTTMSLIYNTQGLANIEWALGRPGTLRPVFADLENDLAAAIEYGVMGKCATSNAGLTDWLEAARKLSLSHGLTRAGFEELKQAAEDVCGGYTRIPPKTFVPGVDH